VKTGVAFNVRTVLLALVCLLFLWSGGRRVWESVAVHHYWAWDFDLRRNEIACAHEGIDPFDVWERKVENARFCGFARPDKPIERSAEGSLYGDKLPVHAYPAWHMALFWWYGFLPKWGCAALMGALYLCCLVGIIRWCAARLADTPGDGLENALFLGAMFLHPLGGICWTMNYGLLLLASILLLCAALDRGRETLAGVFYSIAMIKPQAGLLLAVPLLIGRKFRALAVAAGICVLETLFASWKLGKTPWELLLQIQRIGAPYEKGIFAELAGLAVGDAGPLAAMAAFAGAVAVGCWWVRKAPEAWIRFVPALAAVPFWTYSQSHDWLVTIPCGVCLLLVRDERPRFHSACVLLLAAWGLLAFAGTQLWFLPLHQTLQTFLHLLLLLAGCIAGRALAVRTLRKEGGLTPATEVVGCGRP